MRTLIFLLLTCCCAFFAHAQNNLLYTQAQIELVYTVEGQTVTLSGQGPNLDDKVVQIHLGEKTVDGGRYLYATLKPKVPIVLEDFKLTMPMSYDSVQRVFTNGFQGWTTAMEYEKDAKLAGLKKIAHGIAGYYGDYKLYKYPKKKGIIHGWTYAYTRQTDGQAFLLGSVDEFSGYTLLQYNTPEGELLIQKDCQGSQLQADMGFMALNVFAATGHDSTVFADYAQHYETNLQMKIQWDNMPVELNPLPEARPGWTSWYHYYHDIDERIILDNLKAFSSRKVPIEMFQIDDGYQKSVGEWTQVNEKFPKGMQYIADSIHACGYKAGLWVAPFICEKDSRIFKEHPNWLLRDEKGEPIPAGLNPGWSGKYYALDIYNQDVRRFVFATLDTILNVWGYDMVKTDFLFAAGIQARNGRNRAQVMLDAMILLRKAAGDKLILGCGVPLGPAFRLVDYCRISSDIHMKWEQKALKWLDARERLSCWNSQTTIIGRRQLTGNFFLNDPDVYVLRDEKNKLKPDQKHTMLLVNNLFGELVFHSDNIANYSPEQMDMYLSAFPLLDKSIERVEKDGDLYQAYFSIADRKYLAVINLGKKKQTVSLPEGLYFAGNGNILQQELTVKGYQSVCLYQVSGEGFEVLGGEGYLFPGAEVASLELTTPTSLQVNYLPQAQQKELHISIPNDMNIEQVNGQPVEAVIKNGLKVVVYKPGL